MPMATRWHKSYSTDAGANYQTIAAGIDLPMLRRDRSTLAGSTQARFRVVASDGARSSVAESAVFTVVQSPPEVLISSPGDGSLLAGPRTLVLKALARDAEDGELDGSSIRWSSSLDGALGTGEVIEVAAADLSEGLHTITATATDRSSMQATAAVTVTVRRDNRPPTPVDDIALAARSATVAVDVTDNDTDPDRDLASYALVVLAQPSSGTAGVEHRAGAQTLAYSADAVGYDVLLYALCDPSGSCVAAELTVAVLDDG